MPHHPCSSAALLDQRSPSPWRSFANEHAVLCSATPLARAECARSSPIASRRRRAGGIAVVAGVLVTTFLGLRPFSMWHQACPPRRSRLATGTLLPSLLTGGLGTIFLARWGFALPRPRPAGAGCVALLIGFAPVEAGLFPQDWPAAFAPCDRAARGPSGSSTLVEFHGRPSTGSRSPEKKNGAPVTARWRFSAGSGLSPILFATLLAAFALRGRCAVFAACSTNRSPGCFWAMVGSLPIGFDGGLGCSTLLADEWINVACRHPAALVISCADANDHPDPACAAP